MAPKSREQKTHSAFESRRHDQFQRQASLGALFSIRKRSFLLDDWKRFSSKTAMKTTQSELFLERFWDPVCEKSVVRDVQTHHQNHEGPSSASSSSTIVRDRFSKRRKKLHRESSPQSACLSNSATSRRHTTAFLVPCWKRRDRYLPTTTSKHHLFAGLQVLDSPGLIPTQLANQEAARKIAMCNNVGDAAYVDSVIATQLIHTIKTLPDSIEILQRVKRFQNGRNDACLGARSVFGGSLELYE